MGSNHSIEGMLTDHDVPDAVRGYYDAGIAHFVIEFRYLTDEKWHAKEGDQLLRLRVGRDSKRLLGVEIDVRGLKAHAPKPDDRSD